MDQLTDSVYGNGMCLYLKGLSCVVEHMLAKKKVSVSIPGVFKLKVFRWMVMWGETKELPPLAQTGLY